MIIEKQVLQSKENGRLKIDKNKSNLWNVLNNRQIQQINWVSNRSQIILTELFIIYPKTLVLRFKDKITSIFTHQLLQSAQQF